MINLGLISPSNILISRFLPAVSKIESVKIIAISVPSKNEWNGDLTKKRHNNHLKRAEEISQNFNCKVYLSHEDLIKDNEIDCVYISTPPTLHYETMKQSLLNNKHVFVEKPICLSMYNLNSLTEIAIKKELVFHENYMFLFHKRINELKKYFDKYLSKVKNVSLKFTFPFRGKDDFRYNLKLGGGAVFDTSGYVIKLAQILGDYNLKIDYCNLDKIFGGTLILKDNQDIIYDCIFGMDHDYRCEAEIQLKDHTIKLPRVFTVRPDEKAEINKYSSGNLISNKFFYDDSFKNSFLYFINLINDKETFKKEILKTEKTLKILTTIYES